MRPASDFLARDSWPTSWRNFLASAYVESQPDFNCDLVCLGSAVITDRSKEFTDSGDRNTAATSGSNMIATVPSFMRDAKRFGQDLR
jgi:hypothetical protein